MRHLAAFSKQNCFKMRVACHDQRYIQRGNPSFKPVLIGKSSRDKIMCENGEEKLSPSSCLLVYTNARLIIVYWKYVE